MNLLKKIAKKTLIYILIVLTIWLACTPKATFASETSTGATTADASTMTEEQLRDKFVNDIVNFYNQHGSQCSYSVSGRTATYKNDLGPNAGSYQFDCVGWVSCAFHWFMGLGMIFFTIFVDPTPPLHFRNRFAIFSKNK